jgi:acetyltransferase-like isoleucine patch superfamily enzyme
MSVLRRVLAVLHMARLYVAVGFWSGIARLRLWAHGAEVGQGLRVWGPIRLHCHHTSSIRIGDHCRIQSGFAGNPVGASTRMALWLGRGANLTIGDRVGLSNSTIVCMKSVSIENDVYLGGGSQIYDTDFHSVRADERGRPGNPGTRTRPVVVRARAFVGGHSTILKGVTVGEEAVVGAGSVVRSDVPERQIWAGNPAVFVRDLRTGERPPLATLEPPVLRRAEAV